MQGPMLVLANYGGFVSFGEVPLFTYRTLRYTLVCPWSHWGDTACDDHDANCAFARTWRTRAPRGNSGLNHFFGSPEKHLRSMENMENSGRFNAATLSRTLCHVLPSLIIHHYAAVQYPEEIVYSFDFHLPFDCSVDPKPRSATL